MTGKLFDVLIIGGGINGSGVARDAALRGLSVAVVDKRDFGWGTTSRSTRLAHGGLRYLEMFDFALVRESLRERELLLRNAPHLVHPLPFVTPVYRWSRRGPSMIKIGMKLYDLLSYDKSVPWYRWHNREGILALEPGLDPEGLFGGALYYDAQIDLPERLCVENVMDAARHGAAAANYVEMESVSERTSEGCLEVALRDVLTDTQFTVRARVVVNATGPWSDTINLPGSERLRTTKGAHLVVPKITDHAIVMLAQRDGRLFFAVPWMGYSLIGTTDTDFTGDPGEARTDGDDLQYLVTETKRFFPEANIDPIFSTMAGVRPLVRQQGAKSESAVSRKHKVTDSHPGAGHGVISVMGGKLTSYRALAEEVTDDICKKLGKKARCTTRGLPMYGGDIPSVEKATEALLKAYQDLKLPRETVHNIVKLYGSQGGAVLERCRAQRELARPLHDATPDIVAQVVYGIENEMVRTSADFIMRRTGMGFLPGRGRDAYAEVARLLREAHGWSKDEEARDRADFEAQEDLLSVPGVDVARAVEAASAG